MTIQTTDWIALSEQQPPERSGPLLVTNNIKARDAFGHMSHLWLVRMVHVDPSAGGFSAFEDNGFRKIEGLTHWRYAVPTEQAA